MSNREIKLIGGPHDGRVLVVSDSFTTVHTVAYKRVPGRFDQLPVKWWERLIGRKPVTFQWPDDYEFTAHTYDAKTGHYLDGKDLPRGHAPEMW